MGGLYRQKNSWWDYLKDEFFSIFKHIKGSITLGNGYTETEIKIDPEIKISRVYVAVVAEHIPVCAGNVDKVGAIQNGKNSFILYADIKSSTATVYWLIDISDEQENINNI